MDIIADQTNGKPVAYTPEELEFIATVRAYQAKTGRVYPGWSEILAKPDNR